MFCDCENKSITIYKGFGTHWNNRSLIYVSFESDIDLTGFSAIFKVLDIEKSYTDISEGFSIDLTKQETSKLPVGLNYGELIIIDNETNKRPFTTALPLEVKNWVDGDINLDNFNITVNTKIKLNQLKIHIETPAGGESDIKKYIEEHNLDESAHPYILENKQDKLTSENAGDGISITDVGGIIKINNTQTSAEWGNITGTLSNQTDLQQALNNKQNTIGDLDTIRSGAALGATALQPNDVVNNTSSTATDAPLSANMGKSLQDQVDNLKARGRFLALWNCATGLAQTNPPQTTYEYKTGDYFIVGTVASGGGTNYRPSGSSYTTGVASTVVETEGVAVDDVYYYDGTNWSLQINTQKEVAFVNIAGSPYDNTNLASALNDKQDELTVGTGISIENNVISNTGLVSVTYDSVNERITFV